MYYVAGFGGRRGLEASEGAANYLDEQTEVSRVFIEGGILYVIAEPLFVVDFDIDFFLEQLDLYLADVRLVGNYLYG
ncbi:MAG: hypothetical protein A3E78_03650 [Alphaproteobacteria bacterium RIFCSPHIGHO2_12_FULL_63_12]|nr:MAG: hypothetical protein A3E78_03650 [Alphaproteobacteria bacterium RIFCSPHIGHO2_12_FULL_63_12]